MNLIGLNPERVWHYFEAISAIPRESGNEKAVSDYLVKVAQTLNLKHVQEPCNNVIIYKPASAGYENAPRVILQGHMDMVCVKDADSDHDFDNDPLKLFTDGDWLGAEGTTLGGDNGIAVAMALAILEDQQLAHPALTVLITVAEETGMDGAIALNGELINGDILINLDSEEEGVVLASNAGGVNVDVNLPITTCKNNYANSYKITIDGLKGGHSGMEINKHRANAIKLMGRLLQQLSTLNGAVFNIAGGSKMNAIASDSHVFYATDADVASVMQQLAIIEEQFKEELQVADSGVKISFERCENASEVFDEDSQKGLIALLLLTPYGVQTMSASIEGLVESSNNLGVLSYIDGQVVLVNALRSSVKSLKEKMCLQIYTLANLIGGSTKRHADYPEWSYKVNSPIRDLMIQTYHEMTGQTLDVQAIHAGLECGLLREKLGDLDMISLGPNMHEVHTPRERLSIGSTERVYHFLVEVLKRIK